MERMRDMRTLHIDVALDNGSSHAATSYCELPGCSNGTRGSKPYCPEHVGHAEYPARIMATIAGRARELELAELGKLPVDSQLIDDAIQWLTIDRNTSKVITVARLGRDLHISAGQAVGIAKCLCRNGLAVRGGSVRGNSTITLTSASRNYRRLRA